MAVSLAHVEMLEPLLDNIVTPQKYSNVKHLKSVSKFNVQVSNDLCYYGYDQSFNLLKELEGKLALYEEYLEYMEGDNMETVQEISVVEAAKTLGVSTKTIRNYIHSGKIASRLSNGTRGRKLYLNLEDVLSLKGGMTEEVSVEVIQPEKPQVIFVSMEKASAVIDKRINETKQEMFAMLEEYRLLVEKERAILEERLAVLENKKPWYSRLMFWNNRS